MTMAGFFADSTDFWAGGTSTSDPSTKGDASVRLDAANGRMYAEANRDVIFAAESTADFEGEGSAFADTLLSDNYLVTAFSPDTNNSDVTGPAKDILNKKYLKPYWINKLEFRFNFTYSETQSDAFNKVVVRLTYAGNTDEITFTSTPGSRSVLSLDLTGVSDGTEQVISIEMQAYAGDVTGADNTVEGRIRRDMLLIGSYDPTL
jgi:hypothetical protein